MLHTQCICTYIYIHIYINVCMINHSRCVCFTILSLVTRREDRFVLKRLPLIFVFDRK